MVILIFVYAGKNQYTPGLPQQQQPVEVFAHIAMATIHSKFGIKLKKMRFQNEGLLLDASLDKHYKHYQQTILNKTNPSHWQERGTTDKRSRFTQKLRDVITQAATHTGLITG